MIPSKSIDYIFKNFIFVVAVIAISLGTIGGCSNGGGGNDDPDLAVLGDHRGEPLADISAEIRTGPHTGEPNNILLDGTSIDDLTPDEIELIRDAYDEGFIIVLYDMTERDIAQLYRDIIGHPLRHAELESLEDILEGDSHAVFTIEHHSGIDWTSTAQFEMTALREFIDGLGEIDVIDIVDPEAEFTPHGIHIKSWIESHEERVQELIEDGLIVRSAEELLDDLDMRDEFDAELSQVTRTTEGTLLDLTTANIHTSQNQVSFQETTAKDTFAMTSKVWIVTADTPTGIFSFLLVEQDFNLATSNGFTKNSDTQQYWYLQNFSVSNTYQVNGTLLGSNDAQLLQESPATNQATTSTETTSVSASISGTVGADQTSGANASVSGGVSWSTSNTVSKADVSINNLSLSNNTVSNDATWQFLPRSAEILSDSCDNSIHNLADLAHNTFTPVTAFVVRIDSDYTGDTMQLKSEFTIQTRNTYVGNCNIFGCACDAKNQNGLDPWQPTHSQSVRIPQPPEGPTGDPTCSDGVDNDVDGGTDSGDNSC